MRLIIVSGLSGSGKSVALHTLEDDGFYCIDNLPSTLLPALVGGLSETPICQHDQIAVGIDARSEQMSLDHFPQMLRDLKNDQEIDIEILFLQTDTRQLIQRFSETRRKHPLSLDGTPLLKAIERERDLLSNVLVDADLVVDTTSLNLHQLRQIIQSQLLKNNPDRMSLQFQSFGFKHGIPANTDFIFDVRCLPNPHWQPNLRAFTGNDQPVIDFLQQHHKVEEMYQHIKDFLTHWVPVFQDENRAYLTVSIGCTGGRHRSVYICNRLHEYFTDKLDNVSKRHRES